MVLKRPDCWGISVVSMLATHRIDSLLTSGITDRLCLIRESF